MPNPAEAAGASRPEQPHGQQRNQAQRQGKARRQDPAQRQERGRGPGPGPEQSPAPAGESGRELHRVPDPDSPQVRYVFAVGRGGGAFDAAAGGLSGPSGAPVRTVAGGAGLCALVSDVPAGLYDESGLKAQLEDMERLEALARSHHDVVAAAYEHTTVLPMRLATVYLDDARVTAMLAERSGEFDALLSRLEGHVEWGVKLYADPGDAAVARESAGSPDGDAPPPGSSPGRAYLQQRKRQRSTHRDAYRAAGAVAERVTAFADGLATAKVAHRPQQGELASGPGENTVNDAYLVPAARSEDFRAAIDGLGEDVPGVRVEVTGPWAPYSFATPPSAPQQQPTGAFADGR